MATFIIAALILGAAGYIIYKKVVKIKSGDFSCEGCKGEGPGCSNCPLHQQLKADDKEENQ